MKSKSEPEDNVRKVADAEICKAINGNVLVSAAVGILPLPFVNLAAVTASNIHLVRKISDLYGVEFKEGVAKKNYPTLC